MVLRGLVDSGCTGTIILNDFTARRRTWKDRTGQWTTKGGTFCTTKKAKVPLIFADFTRQKQIEWECHVDTQSKSKRENYDIILGKDIQQYMGLDILNSSLTLKWDGIEVPMREFGALRDRSRAMEVYNLSQEAESTAELAKRTTEILDAHYEKANLEQLCKEQSHLSEAEQGNLLRLLRKYETLFDGTLGEWKGTDIDLELRDDAKPYHARPFPIPQVHEGAMRREVERLCALGVLEEDNDSEWGAPSFIIPKKNGTVRFISDFRKLNTMLKRKPYPIPKIQDMLLKLQGFQYASSLDLNMGYYTIRLSPAASKLCTIVLPFGKYKYKRLPMGVAGSPDIFQAKMSSLMAGLEFVRTYLDDVLIVSSSTFNDHLTKLEQALARIAKAGLKVNAQKSFFGRGEIEYLGYWVTREGVQPLPKKVDSILAMKAPKNRKELRGFIGLVNYYRDMWRRRSHVLAPLTSMTSKNVPWRWGEEQQKAFNEAKRIISKEAILAFPNFLKRFVIYTDASKYQLGGVITQDGRPLAFYSRKLTDAQTRYTTTERELLSIVETLKEFRTILLGQKITIYTDHKNLLFNDLKTDRVLRWRLLIEEFGANIEYIKGVNNVVADVLSRYPRSDTPVIPVSAPTREQAHELFAGDRLPADLFPLSFRVIAEYQQRDLQMQQLTESHPDVTRKIFRGGEQLICYKDKIYIPRILRNHVINWYHEYLMHPGELRTAETIAQHLYWPGIKADVKKVVQRCDPCQKGKTKRLKYGKLPEKLAEAQPWEHLCVDTIGPYKIRRRGRKPLEFMALTFIDPATGWFEMTEIKNKQADNIANMVEKQWLSRYPWPELITYDAGPEFKAEFQELIKNEYAIKAKPSSKRNPQSNAILERVHGTIGNMIRTFNFDNVDDDEPFAGLVSAVCFGIRSTYHTTLKATPGQLVFGRDMIFPIQHQADWQMIEEQKQRRIAENNKRENERRVEHDYAVGDRVLKLIADPNKVEPKREGPCTIERVHTNGTVTLRFGNLIERLNIRQIVPYKS